MNVSVGVMEARPAVSVELKGRFVDGDGKAYAAGRYRFTSKVALEPADSETSTFAIDDVTIGIGFHWERNERQVFRGALRILERPSGLTVINDVPLEDYVTSVISSEMSASCPRELLRAHAVIARSWLRAPLARDGGAQRIVSDAEIFRWYGREAHPDFDVCADDHCQRYQGITKTFSPAASEAVLSTSGQFLMHQGTICDTRFSKCCGGITERFSTAWDNIDVPYLKAVFDGPSQNGSWTPEAVIRSDVPAYCNTKDRQLLDRILPGFDQETRDFFRWRVDYTPGEMRDLVKSRLDRDLGDILDLEPLERGPSGRIFRLKILGSIATVTIGKELEIRRALSRSHLYSSAFVVDRENGRFVLRGAGWGHGVGLCQIGAAVMASQGKSYEEILSHYYPGTRVGA